MHQNELPDGERVARLGQGTWRLGESSARRREEIAALRLGIDLGMTLIDTAEMYGEGATERFLSEALSGVRDRVFLVSKAYPANAGRGRLAKACEASLQRLKTDRLDLYLLHWRGAVPLAETVDAMQSLQQAGKIRHWGVSNFDTGDMAELFAAGGQDCTLNQILYNLVRRGSEFDLIPAMRRRGLPVMAYSPIEQGRLAHRAALDAVAARHGVKPLQIALAFVLHQPGMLAIPKASSLAHVRENRAAGDISLTEADLADLERTFPAPLGKVPLAML